MSESPIKEEQKTVNTINNSDLNANNVVVGDGNTLNKNETINNIKNKIGKIEIKKNIFGKEVRTFSINDAKVFIEKDIQYSQQLFVYPEEQLEDLLACLHHYRILLLAGPPESGKLFTSKNLSLHLKVQLNTTDKILWFNPEAAECEINFRELIQNTGQLKEKILIINDIFAHENASVIRFFRSLNPEQIADITEKLNKLGAFILFTADNNTYEKFLPSRLTIKREIIPLDNHLLKKGMEQKLVQFCSQSPNRSYPKAMQLLEGKREEIIARAKTMPKIAFFIEQELDKNLAGKPVETSIKEFFGNPDETIKPWFLEDLSINKAQLEASTFALSLAMFNGISYADFVPLHKKMTKRLLEEFVPYETFKNFTFSFSERPFLEKCRAIITKESTSNSYRIEFSDNEYKKAFLDILWGNYMNILIHLAPFLEEFVEETPHPYLKRLIIENLVKIGTLAPDAIIIPIIERWAQKQRYEYRVYIGYLYESIFNMEDENFKTFCIKKLRTMAMSDDVEEQLTAVVAYTHIGFKNLEFGMGKLREIQEEIIDQSVLDSLNNLGEILDDDGFDQILEDLYNKAEALFSYIQFSIVALAIHHPPIDVFMELKRWICHQNKKTKIGTALFLLGPDGILVELTLREKKVFTEDQSGKKEEWNTNLLLYSLIDNQESITKMAQFLYDIYNKCFPEFRQDMRNALIKTLFQFLEKWAIDNLSILPTRLALKQLLTHLYHIADLHLKESLWNSITHWTIKKKKDVKLKSEDIEKEEKELNLFINELRKSFFSPQELTHDNNKPIVSTH